jgi:hypothetical protein
MKGARTPRVDAAMVSLLLLTGQPAGRPAPGRRQAGQTL